MSVAPVSPLAASAKSVRSTPVTASLKVTSHCTLATFVGVALTRLMDSTVGTAASKFTVLSVLVAA